MKLYYNRSYPHWDHMDKAGEGTFHRAIGDIPGCVPAHDIWVFAEDPARNPDRLYMTIKNPSKPYRPAYLA